MMNATDRIIAGMVSLLALCIYSTSALSVFVNASEPIMCSVHLRLLLVRVDAVHYIGRGVAAVGLDGQRAAAMSTNVSVQKVDSRLPQVEQIYLRASAFSVHV